MVVKGLSDENDALKNKLQELEAQHRAELDRARKERETESSQLAGRVAELESELVDAVASKGDGGDEESDDDAVGGLMAHLTEKRGESERAQLEKRLAELEEQLVDAVVGASEAETLSAENEMLKRRLSQLNDGVVAPWVVPDIETEQRLEVENTDLRNRIDALTAELAQQAEAAAAAEEAGADAGFMSHLNEKRAVRLSKENESLRSQMTSLEGELGVTVDLETVEALTRENERLTRALEEANAANAAAATKAAASATQADATTAEIIAENRTLLAEVARLKRQVKEASVSPVPTQPDDLDCTSAEVAAPMLEAVARFAEEQGSSLEECARGFMAIINAHPDLEAAVRRFQKVTPLYEPAEIVAGE